MIQLDKPIEVTESQYNYLMNVLSGIVAGRIDNGKYFIKIWHSHFINFVQQYLSK